MRARLAKGKRVGPKEGKDGKVTCGSHRTVTGGTNVPSGKIKEPPRVCVLRLFSVATCYLPVELDFWAFWEHFWS